MLIRYWERSKSAAAIAVAVSLLGLIPTAAAAHDQPEGVDTTAASEPTEISVSVPAPSDNPATLAPLATDGNCTEMTDSFLRLYRGYFDRRPTADEFRQAVDRHRTGAATLSEISSEMLESSEFALEYGELNNGEFIDYVFESTIDRPASSTERDEWLSSLKGGHSRATMMLAFTESADFVRLTQTTTPLAGYARWYPSGAHWYCGRGSGRMEIVPLAGERISSDFIFVNAGVQASNAELWVLESNFNRNVQMTSGSIPPMFTDYNWDGLFSGDGNYGNHIDIQANDATRWIVVFYPTSIGANRPGWELEPS